MSFGLQNEDRVRVNFLAAVHIWSVARVLIFVALLVILSKTVLRGYIVEDEGS